MRTLRLGLVILLVLAGVACVGPTKKGFVPGDQAPENIRKQLPLETTAESCGKHRGVWRKVEDPTIFPAGGYCQFKAPDGGQSCKSSQDCAGYCELSFDDPQGESHPRCSTHLPPRWDRCVPGYFENGQVLGKGECFGTDAEVQ